MKPPRSIAEAAAALRSDPARAEALCRALLEVDPKDGDAQLVLSEALRLQGDLAGARNVAEAENKARPHWFGAHRQLGVILGELGDARAAAKALRRAGDLNPTHPTI